MRMSFLSFKLKPIKKISQLKGSEVIGRLDSFLSFKNKQFILLASYSIFIVLENQFYSGSFHNLFKFMVEYYEHYLNSIIRNIFNTHIIAGILFHAFTYERTVIGQMIMSNGNIA